MNSDKQYRNDELNWDQVLSKFCLYEKNRKLEANLKKKCMLCGITSLGQLLDNLCPLVADATSVHVV